MSWHRTVANLKIEIHSLYSSIYEEAKLSSHPQIKQKDHNNFDDIFINDISSNLHA